MANIVAIFLIYSSRKKGKLSQLCSASSLPDSFAYGGMQTPVKHAAFTYLESAPVIYDCYHGASLVLSSRRLTLDCQKGKVFADERKDGRHAAFHIIHLAFQYNVEIGKITSHV